MVAVGDSITMGTQDFTTVHDRQEWSYGSQLAKQLGVPFGQPLVTEGGIGPRTWVDGKFDPIRNAGIQAGLRRASAPLAFYLRYLGIPSEEALDRVYRAPGMGQRDPATVGEEQHNFAVAGYELRHVEDVASTKDYLAQMRQGSESMGGLTGEVPLIHAALQEGGPDPLGSALDQAVDKDPDLVLLWAGNNDALETSGGLVDDRTLTPLADGPWEFWDQDPITGSPVHRRLEGMKGFEASTKSLFERLRTETDAQVLVMNIPEVTAIPFLRTLGEKVGDLPFRILAVDGTDVTERLEQWTIPNGVRGGSRPEFPAGSRVNLIRLMGAFLAAGPVRSADEMDQRLRDLTAARALFTEAEVLDTDEIATVNGRIRAYNEVLAREAQGDARFHLVDMHGIFEEVHRDGRPLRGEGEEVRVTSTFTGARERGMEGMFSFDGVHPSDTGHAVLANLMLDRLRQDLGDDPKWAFLRDVQPVDEKAVFRGDPHRAGAVAVPLVPEALDWLRGSGLPG